MAFHGKNFIGFKLSRLGKHFSTARNPKTSEALEGQFYNATEMELEEAIELSTKAYYLYRKTSSELRADFLEAIADEIFALGDRLVDRVVKETALPEARVIGERARTMNQLRHFSTLLSEGSWLEANIDTAEPDRTPSSKPDIRKMRVPIGPVAVFAASNFPLAFSVAGGDTASALAAGNPVIVKAHSGHLGTSELIAGAIITAAEKTGMPHGVFSLVHGSGSVVGQALVKHSSVKAVGFTGSYNAGRTLMDIAANRTQPIPVFAEMGSTNPIVLLKHALQNQSENISTQLVQSITLGTGQFCTNPGLLIVENYSELETFINNLSEKITNIAPSTMLNTTVFTGYQSSYKKVFSEKGVTVVGVSHSEANPAYLEARPTLVSVSAETFMRNPMLHEEVFGPFSMIVVCDSSEEISRVLQALEGQLTASLFASDTEMPLAGELLETLTEKAGRVLLNNVPTGVEVCASMHHGGPFPASSHGGYTSVGADAIKRFSRPVAFQNFPDNNLPDALKDANPLDLWRKVNNQWTKKNVER